jgi:hypothetical protein
LSIWTREMIFVQPFYDNFLTTFSLILTLYSYSLSSFSSLSIDFDQWKERKKLSHKLSHMDVQISLLYEQSPYALACSNNYGSDKWFRWTMVRRLGSYHTRWRVLYRAGPSNLDVLGKSWDDAFIKIFNKKYTDKRN